MRLLKACIIIWGLLLALSIMGCWYNYDQKELNQTEQGIPSGGGSRKTGKRRRNITFIMGEDKSGSNPYYSEAYHYYAVNDTNSKAIIVDSCRSLIEIRDYLTGQAPGNGLPWGLVNIVVHSNEWTGLSIPVFKGGKRANAVDINKAIKSKRLKPLPDNIADRNTRIILHGCGLGKNKAIMEALRSAFGGAFSAPERPIVSSSEFFILYQSIKDDDGNSVSERCRAKVWYAFYKTGFRPADFKLSKQLNERYPGESIKFRDALSRKKGHKPGNTFHRTFSVPISWIVLYPDKASRPGLETKEMQMAWVMEQTDLIEKIETLDIPMEYFNWTVNKVRHFSKDGKKEYSAVKALAECTVLCVLEIMDRSDKPQSGKSKKTKDKSI